MENVNDVKPGMNVKITRLEKTDGMFIKQEYLDRRKAGEVGTVLNYVPGHGGDVWWIRQSNGIAAYSFTEFDPA